MEFLNNFKKKFLNFNANSLQYSKKINTKDIDISFTKLGSKNKNKVFYVIKRTPGAGLFSNVIFVLNHLLIAKRHNFIPIIDMQNFPTIYSENNKINNTKNSWEYYFENLSNYKLKDIYQSQKVIFTDNKYYSNFVYDLEKSKKLINLFQKKIKVKKDILRDFEFLN